MAGKPTIPNNRQAERFLFAFLDLDKVLPWYTGTTLRGYSLSDQGDGWLLVVKAQRGNDKLVYFQGARRPFECWEYFLRAICRKDFKWAKDKFA